MMSRAKVWEVEMPAGLNIYTVRTKRTGGILVSFGRLPCAAFARVCTADTDLTFVLESAYLSRATACS